MGCYLYRGREMSHMYNKANYDDNIYNCLHFVFFLLSCATLISTPVELILLIPPMSGIHINGSGLKATAVPCRAVPCRARSAAPVI